MIKFLFLDLLICIVMFLTAIIVGDKILSVIKFFKEKNVMYYLYSLGVGFFVLSYYAFLLVLLNKMAKLYLIIFFIIVIILCINELKLFFKQLAQIFLKIWKNKFDGTTLFEKILLLILIVMIASNFIFCYVPPVQIRELMYDLAIPKLVVNNISLENKYLDYYPYHYFFYYFFQMLYSVGMCLHKEGLSFKLINYFIGITNAVLLYLILRQISGRKIALLSSIIFYSMPLVIINSGSANLELAMVFYGLLSLGLLVEWLQTKIEKYLYLSAFFCGITFAIKLPGFAIIISFFIFIIFMNIFCIKHSIGLLIKNLLLCGVICFISFFPWMVRNFLITKNFFYPFQIASFEGDKRFVYENLFFAFEKQKFNFKHYLKKNIKFHTGDIDQSGGPFIFTFLAISFFLYQKFSLNEKLYFMFGIINFFVLYFLLTLPETRFEYRYYLFSYTIFSGVSGITISKLKQLFSKEYKIINTIIIIMMLVPSTLMSVYFAKKRLKLFFYYEKSVLENYFQQKMPEYEMVKFIRNNISKEKNIVFANITSLNQYYFDNKIFMFPFKLEYTRNLEIVEKKLKHDNIDYLLIQFNPRLNNVGFYRELKTYSDKNFVLVYKNRDLFLYKII